MKLPELFFLNDQNDSQWLYITQVKNKAQIFASEQEN